MIAPLQPPDPRVAIRAYEDYRQRAEQQLRDALTDTERREAELWIDNADRNLTKWRAIAAREVQP